MSGLVKIVETASGSVTSTKQFVRCGSQICEERNAGSAITKQFFAYGQTISGTSYYYFRNHLGSITDVFTADGTVVAHYEYGMFGEVTQTVGTLSADFGYAGYYVHAPSGLNLTTYRAYNPSLGRWINRDPIGERGDLNLYEYTYNDPINGSDYNGLKPSASGWQFPGSRPILECICNRCAQDTAQCKKDAENLLNGLKDTWTNNWHPSASDSYMFGYSPSIGGKNCYQWQSILADAVAQYGGQSWSGTSEDWSSWGGNNPFEGHSFVKVCVKDAKTGGDSCCFWIDDGWGSNDLTHTSRPVPPGWPGLAGWGPAMFKP